MVSLKILLKSSIIFLYVSCSIFNFSNVFLGLVISGVLFKILVAFLDTPLLYFFVYLFRRKFDLKIGEEIKI